MARSFTLTVLAASLAWTAGCATQSKFLDSRQEKALETALVRGRFELNCQEATGVVLSREVTQPVLRGPWAGLERAEYTVGVEGCGQRHTYIVICPQGGESCYAAGSDDWKR